MTNPTHDPERDAVAYLGGLLAGPARTDFETHMLACDACWAEVSEARTGRALAEALRDVAPQGLREYLRTLAAAEPGTHGVVDPGPSDALVSRWRRSGPGRSRRSWLSMAAAVLVGAVIAGGATLGVTGSDRSADQQTLFAAAEVYQASDVAAERTGRPPVGRLGDLRWQGTSTQELDGRPATVYRYGDDSGARVLLVSSATQFPRAKNAQAVLGTSWTAEIDGAVMFCVDHGGLAWLVISDSRQRSLDAGRQAGLA